MAKHLARSRTSRGCGGKADREAALGVSSVRRAILIALYCSLAVFAASCADQENDEFEAGVADALEETLRQVVEPTPTVGPNPVFDPWAEPVCEAIAAVTPDLKSTILEDDPQLPLAERQQRLEEIRADSGAELRQLLSDLYAVSVPFRARHVHDAAVEMYREALTVLHGSAAEWRDVETGEELDAAVLQLSRDVETAYFVFSFSTDDADPAVLGAIGRAGCDFQDPLGDWVVVGPVNVPIR